MTQKVDSLQRAEQIVGLAYKARVVRSLPIEGEDDEGDPFCEGYRYDFAEWETGAIVAFSFRQTDEEQVSIEPVPPTTFALSRLIRKENIDSEELLEAYVKTWFVDAKDLHVTLNSNSAWIRFVDEAYRVQVYNPEWVN